MLGSVCLQYLYRCHWLVDRFLNVDLNEKGVDLQKFLKEELLPSAGDPQ